MYRPTRRLALLNSRNVAAAFLVYSAHAFRREKRDSDGMSASVVPSQAANSIWLDDASLIEGQRATQPAWWYNIGKGCCRAHDGSAPLWFDGRASLVNCMSVCDDMAHDDFACQAVQWNDGDCVVYAGGTLSSQRRLATKIRNCEESGAGYCLTQDVIGLSSQGLNSLVEEGAYNTTGLLGDYWRTFWGDIGAPKGAHNLPKSGAVLRNPWGSVTNVASECNSNYYACYARDSKAWMLMALGDTLHTNAGEVSTVDLLSGKRQILLFFSSSKSWCKPCQSLIQLTVKAYEQYNASDIPLIFVSQHDTLEDFESLRQSMPWPSVHFTRSVSGGNPVWRKPIPPSHMPTIIALDVSSWSKILHCESIVRETGDLAKCIS